MKKSASIVKTLKLMAVFMAAMAAGGLFSCSNKDRQVPPANLVVYAHDSFVSEWGPGPEIARLFEEKHGIPVEFISLGDVAQVLAQAVLEKDNPRAGVLVGIDNNLLAQALEANILESYTPAGADKIPPELLLDPGYYLIPYDYGFFSINYDSEKIKNPPVSLEGLTDPAFRSSLVLMDPRTSTPGLGFLLWTVKVYGNGWQDFWRRLAPNILTVADGWSSGYALFTSGEAPLVLSYTTSPPYHVEYEDTTRYRASIFSEGNYLQIEGMGIVKNAPNGDAARLFVDEMLTPEFQAILPLTNYMFPINRETPLPASFDYAPQPGTILNLEPDFIRGNSERLIQEWLELMTLGS